MMRTVTMTDSQWTLMIAWLQSIAEQDVIPAALAKQMQADDLEDLLALRTIATIYATELLAQLPNLPTVEDVETAQMQRMTSNTMIH